MSGRVVKIFSSLSPSGVGRRLIEREADQQALGAADPVALHQPHLVGPAVQRIERVQQLLRIFRDLEDPLVHLALLDHRAGAPAAAVDHLLVGEHGHVDRIPVDLALLALGQSGAQEIQEHLLLMLVIRGIAGRELARPVERQPDRPQLLLHRRDIVVGPGLRRHLALDRGIFRRQPERVPAHRMQHVKALGAHVARQHVAERIVADMADMDAPGRVGEHLQHVIFRPRIVVFGGEDRLLVPLALPARLGFAGVVAFGGHGIAGLFVDSGRSSGRRTRPQKRLVGSTARQLQKARRQSLSSPARSRRAIRDPHEAVFDHRVTAAMLGGIERGVGGLDQVARPLAVVRPGGRRRRR